ncbi:DUF4886 domain-containing protein [Lactiplantibacillus daowaiensis]|uniref:DUF4886 domain-containing protein n=1 Tax=Lactiplantibacillus daowaiensis TaxID=2559918 RepID=A0ABW1S2L0_9LACO|nr:DUF4886 domain-containing protein [Lactiplantibacillus daowaiensis]
MRKILCIGSSFGSDGTHYVHDLAASAGVATKVVNLFLPGGMFEQHWANLQSDVPAYLYELNGQFTTEKVSLQTVLAAEDWDDIVSHQASGFTGMQDPACHFAALLYADLKQRVPNARLWLQQTWAFETGCDRDAFAKYDYNEALMYQELTTVYQALATEFNVGLIPVGTVIQNLRQTEAFNVAAGGRSLNRDGMHLDFVYGRYAAGATWAQTLLGLDLKTASLVPESPLVPDETTDSGLVALINEAVMQAKV